MGHPASGLESQQTDAIVLCLHEAYIGVLQILQATLYILCLACALQQASEITVINFCFFTH